MYWVGPVIENGFYYDIDLGEEVLKEVDDRTISFRKYGSEETENLSKEEFIKMIKDKTDKKEA